MEILKGVPVSPGVYIGEAFLLDEGEEVRIPERHVAPERAEGEVARFEAACAKVTAELDGIKATTEFFVALSLCG